MIYLTVDVYDTFLKTIYRFISPFLINKITVSIQKVTKIQSRVSIIGLSLFIFIGTV